MPRGKLPVRCLLETEPKSRVDSKLCRAITHFVLCHVEAQGGMRKQFGSCLR